MTFRHSIRLLGLSGSTRSASLNTRLLALVRAQLDTSVALDIVSAGAFNLPLYDQELETNMPPGARALADHIASSSGLVVASPEHNGSVSTALKNALDWISRLPGQSRPLEGKPALLMSASPGRLGGRRGLVHLREIMSGLGARVCDADVTVPHAETALEEAEREHGHALRGHLASTMERLVGAAEVQSNDLVLDPAGGVK